MLNHNIQTLRKNKGYTQEELAIRLHVVRQTISKWEKGISVPDAETLQRLADVLEVSVSELLGMPIEEKQMNEVSIQLSRINEQLMIKNRRSSRIWKIIGCILLGFVLINLLMLVLFSNLRYEQSEEINSQTMEVYK
ncbi:MAG: helix-turn-helix transcriptional regulator [Erysipelotrichaceae bacterium]|nr:helix-turn-helix transcriptional regulator [Erysipelotrichaceae bacterium]